MTQQIENLFCSKIFWSFLENFAEQEMGNVRWRRFNVEVDKNWPRHGRNMT